MIHMPRRSVTRFFIPLIDVLILLFCIFLLLEYNSETKLDLQSLDVEAQTEQAKVNQEALITRDRELRDRDERLRKFEDANPELARVLEDNERLKKENEKLKKAAQQDLKDSWIFRKIDVKADDGTISFYDRANAKQPLVKIDNEAAAKDLIKRHLKEAAGRKVYYIFEFERDKQTFMTVEQRQQYHKWFKGPDVANTLPG